MRLYHWRCCSAVEQLRTRRGQMLHFAQKDNFFISSVVKQWSSRGDDPGGFRKGIEQTLTYKKLLLNQQFVARSTICCWRRCCCCDHFHGRVAARRRTLPFLQGRIRIKLTQKQKISI